MEDTEWVMVRVILPTEDNTQTELNFLGVADDLSVRVSTGVLEVVRKSSGRWVLTRAFAPGSWKTATRITNQQEILECMVSATKTLIQ
ncbi:hypothetical protein [Jatrophihabitans fulvus]